MKRRYDKPPNCVRCGKRIDSSSVGRVWQCGRCLRLFGVIRS